MRRTSRLSSGLPGIDGRARLAAAKDAGFRAQVEIGFAAAAAVAGRTAQQHERHDLVLGDFR